MSTVFIVIYLQIEDSPTFYSSNLMYQQIIICWSSSLRKHCMYVYVLHVVPVMLPW